MSEFEVRANIDECIEAACLAAVEGVGDKKLAAALLTHREQRFRLSYVLGEMSADANGDQGDFSFEPGASGADVSVSVSEKRDFAGQRQRRLDPSPLCCH
jgi:hypothetical protein